MRANNIKRRENEACPDEIILEEKENGSPITKFRNRCDIKINEFKLQKEDSSENYEAGFKIIVRDSGRKLK